MSYDTHVFAAMTCLLNNVFRPYSIIWQGLGFYMIIDVTKTFTLHSLMC